MDTVVAELVSFLEALKSGSALHYLIVLAVVLIGLALIAALAYQRVVIKRSQTASKATQENFETIAADLRQRALEVMKEDEGLRKRELEVKERKQQQQVLKRSQRALKGSVSHSMLQTDFKGLTSVVPDSSKADLQRNPDEGGVKNRDDKDERALKD